MTDIVRKPDQNVPAPPLPEVNFALVLSRMIDSVEQNPAELRATVYELARIKLVQQFGREDAREVKRLVGALEEAIVGVEAFSRQEHERKAGVAADAALEQAAAERLAITNSHSDAKPGIGNVPAPDAEPVGTKVDPASPRPRSQRVMPPKGAQRQQRGALSLIARLGFVFLVAAAIVASVAAWPRLRGPFADLKAIYDRQIGSLVGASNKSAAAQPSATPSPVAVASPPAVVRDSPALPFPLPTTFGIYAIADGRLQELKALPGKVPDSRVAVSAAITTPSETTLPDGLAKFVVFRRDGATNAPDRVDVRVVARVTRAMGVDESGKAKITPAQDAWVIRNVATPYKVGPVDDQHPEMFLIQPETTEASLPAGRYVLVVKGQGYDFTVDGPISDPRQCVERVDAVNGTFYSQCR